MGIVDWFFLAFFVVVVAVLVLLGFFCYGKLEDHLARKDKQDRLRRSRDEYVDYKIAELNEQGRRFVANQDYGHGH